MKCDGLMLRKVVMKSVAATKLGFRPREPVGLALGLCSDEQVSDGFHPGFRSYFGLDSSLSIPKDAQLVLGRGIVAPRLGSEGRG